MAKIQNYLAELVFEQLPEFVQDQYPLFADFLHAYYRFLQQDKHAQEIIQNARAYADIEKTIAELIPSFFRQYGQDVPRNTEADTALFIKKMSDLYASKGTERGYKLLFNILYKEAIDFYYPYSNVLKPSDGKWIQTYRLFAYQDGNSDLFKFENSTITGATSGATATVSSVIRYAEQGFTIYELGLDADSVAGRFSSFERITARKLLRINGSNDPRAVIRDDLLDSEVYDYYKNRIDDLRRVLFKDEAGNDVGIRRLVNLGIRYGWTESQVLELYNLIFSVALDPITWSRTTPSVNHPATLNISNAYTYYSNNPIVFHDVMTENNAFASTVDQRIISTALEFGWTASQTADLVNKAFERATIAAEWDMFLQPTGPTYELVSGFLYPMLSEVDIVTPGLGYRPGETVSIQSNTGFSALAEVYEVDRSGGIKNVRVLRPGLNYNANTVLSIPRVLGRVQTAEQLVQNQIATLKFQNSHGLVKGDTITVAPDDFIATESNVLTVTIYSAGGDAVDKTHGVFIGDSAADVSNSNVGYTVSVYGSEEKAFVDHKTFDLSNGITESNLVSEQLSAEQYQNNYAVSNVLYVNNLGNIGGGNVHVMGASNTLTYFYIDDVVSHTKIKLSGMLHFVGEWNNEQVSLIEGANIVTRITKGAGDPVIAPAFAGQTNTYVGNQSYSSAVAVDKVIIDLAKPAEFETSTDAHVTDRSTVGISLNPISIIQTVVGVFGYLATDETFGTATDTFRSLTSVGKYSLENVSTLYFEVFRGGGVWGDAPESGEELKLQYSQDGVAWTNIVSVSIAVSDTTWTLVTATVPAGAKIPTGVYVRFYQDGSNDLAAPRDTWAFTSLVNSTTALSTNYGRVSFDTNWIEHTSNIITFSVLAPILAIELDQELYISNVSIDLERDPSLEMSTYLDSVAGNDIIMVHTWGDAKPNRLVAGLEDSMIAIGASGEIYGGDFADRSAYVLVGKPGIGEANGLEKLASVTNNDAANFARLRIKIDNGKLVGENISVVSIPDTRTIQYTKTAPDTQSNVLVLLETTANLAPKISPLVVSEPFWKNNDGMLSDAVFVQGRTRTAAEQDPVYYQNFSYVVQSEHPIAQWRKYALDLMHPAGMQLFGELKLQTLPSNVRDLKPIAVSTEVQDFFAITADKADRTHPESPDFRTDMTFFPSRNLETNPSLLEFDNNSHAVSQTFVGTDYVTVECFFRKLPDPLGPFNLPLPAERTLFSKYRSWEVRTDAGRLFYKIQTFADNRLYDWHWIDTGVFVQYGVPYVLALTYDGIHGKLYLNGTLVHRSTNSELRRNINNNPGVIANKNAHYPKLNASGNLRNSRLNPGTHAIGRFLIYDRALTEPELRENYLNLKGDFGI